MWGYKILWSLYIISLVLVIGEKCPTLITDFSQDNCIAKGIDGDDTFYFHLENNSCIPKCKSYRNAQYRSCSSDKKCMPGYSCDKRCGPNEVFLNITCQDNNDCPNNHGAICDFFCVSEDKESCMAYHINTNDYKNTYWTALKFKPECNNDGTWKAKQCKGGVDGRCMCYDGQGKRLFGEALSQDAANMTCACSRRNSELEKHQITSFHCDSMGNYEPLQCDKVSDQCWCVEPKSGELVSSVVPGRAIHILPCYSIQTYGTQYLRQCESKKFAQTNIENKLVLHGVTYIHQEFILCDDDGAFGSFTIEKDNAYCTWRNNSKIDAWQANIQSGFSDLSCNCARDYYKYRHEQTCLSTGNYKPLQIKIDNSYCVDADGFTKSSIYTTLNETEDLFCAQFY